MDKHMLSPESKKDTALTNKRQIERGVVSKAIYMVTDTLDQSEPLRRALRDAAVGILKDDTDECVATLKRLLILSAEVGIVSGDNIQILLKAIDSMKTLAIVQEEKVITLDGFFSNTQTDTYIDTHTETGDSNYIADNSDDDTKDIHTENRKAALGSLKVEGTSSINNPSFQRSESGPVSAVQPVQNATYTSVVRSSAATLREDIQRQLEKTNQRTGTQSIATTLDIGTRRKKILEVVKSKGQVTIHEFIQSIQGCSSKTIQRELTSLVLSGTLKKTGERRWSKYSLR